VKELFHYFFYSIRKRGLGQTFYFFLLKISNKYFDYKFGLDTSSDVELDNLVFISENKKEGENYGTISPLLFNKIMRTIPIGTDDVFIDFGSGKGRILLLASQFGFCKIKGVEFSPELNIIAQNNILKWMRYFPNTKGKFQLIESDVLLYKFNHTENILYLYNPFSEMILIPLLQNIQKSMKYYERQIFIIYVNQHYNSVIENYNFFLYKEIDLINKKCFIYSNQIIKSEQDIN